MKIKNIILVLCTSLTFCSCSDWLDVSPNNQVDGEDLFNSGSGYRIALNGIYKQMSSQNLWGEELTWGMADVLGQQYTKSNLGSTDSKYWQACQYKYTDKTLEPVIQSIWSTAYNAIANCNELIKNIEAADPSIFQGKTLEQDLIHGEALALRAMLHFEVLRLFAPSVAADDGKKYVPYYATFPSVSEPYLTVKEVLAKIEKDLEEARGLVQTYDNQEGYKLLMTKSYRFEGGDLVTDMFYASRGFRMSYIAITALQARIFSYAGESKKAYDAASEVINYTDDNGEKMFTFTANASFNTNPKMKDDLIFALSNSKEVELFKAWDNMDEDAGMVSIDYDDYTEILDENANDRRWNESGGMVEIHSDYDWYCVISKKYMDDASYTDLDKRIIPVIRLSEMHYIRGEYLAETDPASGALELETVATNRGCTAGIFSYVSTLEEYQEAVLKDARKEFLGEGQLYYFYKKYNILPNSKTNFIFPLPDNEMVY